LFHDWRRSSPVGAQRRGATRRDNRNNCAKLRPAWANYHLAFLWLAYTEASVGLTGCPKK